MQNKKELLVGTFMKPCEGFEKFDPLVWLKKYSELPKSDYVLDEVNWDDIRENLKKYGIRNTRMKCEAPLDSYQPMKNECPGVQPSYNMYWKAEDIKLDINSEFDNMSVQEQSVFLQMQGTLLAIEGIPEPKEFTSLKEKYYLNTKKER